MKEYGGWRYCLSTSLPQQQMEMSVPLQVLATLSWGKTACTHRICDLVDPSAILHTLAKRKKPLTLATYAATVPLVYSL